MPEMRLTLNPPTEGFPWDDLRECQWMAKVPNGEKIAKYFNRLSRVHKRYRQQPDDRRTGDSI